MGSNLSPFSQQHSAEQYLGTKLKVRRGRGRPKGSISNQDGVRWRIERLTKNIKLIPFAPKKSLNFEVHEEHMKGLGLWDFAHVEFCGRLRADVIAKLVGTYRKTFGIGTSNIDSCRIAVSKTSLAHVLKLPRKKGGFREGKGGRDQRCYPSEFLLFMKEFVWNWMLLSEGVPCVPHNAVGWIRLIKNGQLEEVDWAGLVWCMVEAELDQGVNLRECFYASHLQLLIKDQEADLLNESSNGIHIGAKMLESNESCLGREMKESNGDTVTVDLCLGGSIGVAFSGYRTSVGDSDIVGKDVVANHVENDQDGEVLDDAGRVEMVSVGKRLDNDVDVIVDFEELPLTGGEPKEHVVDLRLEQDSVSGVEIGGLAGLLDDKDGKETLGGDAEIWLGSAKIVEQKEKLLGKAIENNGADMIQQRQIGEMHSEIQELRQKLDDLQKQKQAEVDSLKKELCWKNKEIEGYTRATKKSHMTSGVPNKAAPLCWLEEYKTLLHDSDSKLEEINVRLVCAKKKAELLKKELRPER